MNQSWMQGTPRWGYSPRSDGSFRRPAEPAFWLFLLFLGASALVVGSQQLAYLSAYPGAWILSVVLLALTAIPAAVVIYRFDQFEPEPMSMIVAAVVWGGIVAVTFAGLTNNYFLSFLQNLMSPSAFQNWGAAIVAPIDEELYKGAGLVILFLIARDEIDSLMDGLVYGAMIGLGFQTVENMQYFVHAAAISHGAGQVTPVLSSYVLRVLISGLYSHTLFTGLTGFGFAYYVTRVDRSRGTRFLVAGVFAALAATAHFVWNSPLLDSLAGQSSLRIVLVLVMKGIPFLLLMLILAVFARRRERRAFERLIAVEVGSDVLSQDEEGSLVTGRRRRAARRRMAKQKGPMGRVVLKALQRQQMSLALFHTKVKERDHPGLERQRDKVRQLKARLAALPDLS
ncbi:MAG TPA: PrsW family intramembrane metalloprotease [Thermoleophilia bacterium]